MVVLLFIIRLPIFWPLLMKQFVSKAIWLPFHRKQQDFFFCMSYLMNVKFSFFFHLFFNRRIALQCSHGFCPLQQYKYAIIIHMSPSFWAPSPYSIPPPLGHDRLPSWAPSVSAISHSYLLSAGKEWWHRYREPTFEHREGRRKWDSWKKVGIITTVAITS